MVHRIPQIGIDPVLETMFSLIVILACFLIYYKTKEISELSDYKGIKYFRYVFLFFGLTHLFRISVKLIIPNIRPPFIFTPGIFQIFTINLLMTLMIYTSTLMFIYLVLIFVKGEKIRFFERPIFIHAVAVIIALISLYESRQYVFALTQLIAFTFAILLLTTHKNKIFKRRQNPWVIITYAMIFGHFIIIQILEIFSIIFPSIGTILYITALCFFVVLADRIYIHFSSHDDAIKDLRVQNGKKRKA